MAIRRGIILVLLVAVALLGSRQALQTLAWTGMIAADVVAGQSAGTIERTFSGKHPCCLCDVLAESDEAPGREDKRSTVSLWEVKAVRPGGTPLVVSSFEDVAVLRPCRHARPNAWRSRPQVPPPRHS